MEFDCRSTQGRGPNAALTFPKVLDKRASGFSARATKLKRPSVGRLIERRPTPSYQYGITNEHPRSIVRRPNGKLEKCEGFWSGRRRRTRRHSRYTGRIGCAEGHDD